MKNNIVYHVVLEITDRIITEEGYFMMANQEPVTISVSEANNSPENAAGKDGNSVISVERAASKVTFRWKEADQTAGIGANVYPVVVNTTAYQAVVENYWFLEDGEYINHYLIENKKMFNYIYENNQKMVRHINFFNLERAKVVVENLVIELE